MSTSSQNALLESLKELREQKGEKISIADIGSVIESLLTTLQGDISSTDHVIHQELQEIADRIIQAKKEVASMVTSEESKAQMSEATSELDAVVKATEDATNIILDAADAISNAIGEADESVQSAVNDEVTKIFEACNFQDITGQRISKVVEAISFIEEKIDRLNKILSARESELTDVTETGDSNKQSSEADESTLLNGPQLAEDAPTQEEIDALLSSLD